MRFWGKAGGWEPQSLELWRFGEGVMLQTPRHDKTKEGGGVWPLAEMWRSGGEGPETVCVQKEGC